MSARLVLHYDIVSPWSYVAFKTLTQYARAWNVPLELVPTNLGYVMKQSGNKPPISVANKGRWMWQDMRRAEAVYGVKLQQPSNFPFNSLSIQCCLRTLKDSHPDLLESATEYFYRQTWGGEGNMDTLLTPQGLEASFGQWGKLSTADVKTLLETASSKETRTKINAEAVNLVEEGGAFGAPWIVATREKDGQQAAFFGSDRTEAIAQWLGKRYTGFLPGQLEQQHQQSRL